MKRNLRLDRRYTFGEYKYATIYDEFIEIPEELALNSKFVDSLCYLQLLGFEIAYRKYVMLLMKYPHTVNDIDKVVEELEKIKEEEFENLHKIINEYKENKEN